MRGRLTRIGKDIAVLECQEELTFDDRRMVEHLLEQLKDNDSTFEQRHVEVLNFIEEEDQEALNQEEAVFDEHVDRVAELTRRIERLRIPEKEAHVSSPITTTAPNPSVTLVKRLKYIEQQRDVIARSLRSPPPGTEEHPEALASEVPEGYRSDKYTTNWSFRRDISVTERGHRTTD